MIKATSTEPTDYLPCALKHSDQWKIMFITVYKHNPNAIK